MEEWREVVFRREDILTDFDKECFNEMLARKFPDEWDETQKKLSSAWAGNNMMLMLQQCYLEHIAKLEKKLWIVKEDRRIILEENDLVGRELFGENGEILIEDPNV